jgi:predicted GIY-YIG superfamily endonuclease
VSGLDPAAAVTEGTVYLLHFARPHRHARHYLGYADNLEQRLARHRAGSGARLLSIIAAADIDWRLVRTWSRTRTTARRLQGRPSGVRRCPRCRGVARPAPPPGSAAQMKQDMEETPW